jgi:hypothetical protein
MNLGFQEWPLLPVQIYFMPVARDASQKSITGDACCF